jgi:hypothetical protein
MEDALEQTSHSFNGEEMHSKIRDNARHPDVHAILEVVGVFFAGRWGRERERSGKSGGVKEVRSYPRVHLHRQTRYGESRHSALPRGDRVADVRAKGTVIAVYCAQQTCPSCGPILPKLSKFEQITGGKQASDYLKIVCL